MYLTNTGILLGSANLNFVACLDEGTNPYAEGQCEKYKGYEILEKQRVDKYPSLEKELNDVIVKLVYV